MFSSSRWSSLLALVLVGCPAPSDVGNDDADADTAVEEEGSDGFEPGACADVCGTPGCGECPSAEQVDAGGFMIDAREVDNAQYAAMLAVDFDTSVLPAGCEWKLGFVPQDWTDQIDPSLPVVGVDWCDAMVFCAWAGKRLCGALDGGPGSWDSATEGDAWYAACSAGATRAYPYGPDFDPLACNGEDAGHSDILESGALTTCEGGVLGLFDMSGNVWEWTNACASEGGDSTTQCRRRGGGRFSDEGSLRCASDSDRQRGTRDDTLGFRCCG